MQLAGNAEDGWTVIGHTEPAPPEDFVIRDGSTESATYRDTAAEPVWRAERRWRGRGAWYPTLMTVGSMVSLALHAAGVMPPPPMRMDPVFGAFGTIASAIMFVVFGWWALALHLNRTTVAIARGEVMCSHGPIRVIAEKARPVQLEDVELFEVERRDPALASKTAFAPTWQVVARLIGGQRVPVVTRLPEERHAVWLQRKLDTMLV